MSRASLLKLFGGVPEWRLWPYEFCQPARILRKNCKCGSSTANDTLGGGMWVAVMCVVLRCVVTVACVTEWWLRDCFVASAAEVHKKAQQRSRICVCVCVRARACTGVIDMLVTVRWELIYICVNSCCQSWRLANTDALSVTKAFYLTSVARRREVAGIFKTLSNCK
jgi:hypothetical protein